MTAKPLPAVGVAVEGVSSREAAEAGLTVRLAAAMKLLAASDAVSVCAPALIRVAEKVPWPLVSVESGGRVTPALVSLLLKWTVPA